MLVGIINFGQAFSTVINRDEGFFVGYNEKENKKTNQYKIIDLSEDLTFTKKKIE
jgi:hypothetical protein